MSSHDTIALVVAVIAEVIAAVLVAVEASITRISRARAEELLAGRAPWLEGAPAPHP